MTVDIQPNIHIGKVIQNAITFNFRNLREDMTNFESLLENVAGLFALLQEREIDYLLVGMPHEPMVMDRSK